MILFSFNIFYMHKSDIINYILAYITLNKKDLTNV